jgi:hypothetical protein
MSESAISGLQVTVWIAFASLATTVRYRPLALWSNALSTASVMAVTPVWMVGFGTARTGGNGCREAAFHSCWPPPGALQTALSELPWLFFLNQNERK